LREQIQANGDVETELARRHKAVATTVVALLIATLLLSLVSLLGKNLFHQQDNPSLDIAVRIAILILGLGSIAWRRTKLSKMRLQDIGALHGAIGLLSTLERTTLQIAFSGAAIAAIGFIATLLTGSIFYAYGTGAIAVAILLYCYPTRSSWSLAIQRFAQSE
jgi:hypothetical protein